MECILSPHIFSRLIKEEEKVQNKSSFCSFSLPRASLESHRRGFVVYIVVVLLLLSKKGDKQKEQKRQLSSNCDKSCSKWSWRSFVAYYGFLKQFWALVQTDKRLGGLRFLQQFKFPALFRGHTVNLIIWSCFFVIACIYTIRLHFFLGLNFLLYQISKYETFACFSKSIPCF